MNEKLYCLALAILISSFSFAYTDSLWVSAREGRPGDLVTVNIWLRYEGGGPGDSMSAFDIPLTWDATVCSVEAVAIGTHFGTRDWIDMSQIDNQGTMGPPSIPKLTLSAYMSDSGEYVRRGGYMAGKIDFRMLEDVGPSDSACLDTLMEAFSPPVNLRFVGKLGTSSYVPSFSTDCIRYAAFTDSLWIVGAEGCPGALVPVQVWLQYQGGGPNDSIAAFDILLTWDATVCTAEAITIGPDFRWWWTYTPLLIDNQGTQPPVGKAKCDVWAFMHHPILEYPVPRGTHLAGTIDFRILSTAVPSESTCFDTLMTAFSPPVFLGFVDKSRITTYIPSFSTDCIIVIPCTCGDCNGDGSVTVADAIYTVTHIYKGGYGPVCEGDVNLDGRITVADAIYLLTYIYRGGPEPCNP